MSGKKLVVNFKPLIFAVRFSKKLSSSRFFWWCSEKKIFVKARKKLVEIEKALTFALRSKNGVA